MKMSKRFVLGDVHGNFKGLKQVLERSNFDYDNDTLISLGDICDGYSQVYECVEELINIKELVVCKGNHCDWFLQWLESGIHPVKWSQGGYGTATSYLRQIDKEGELHYIDSRYISGGKIQPTSNGYITSLNPDDVPPLHQQFFRAMHNYYKDDDNNIFVHGGFNRHLLLREQMPYVFYWDRDLFLSALSFKAMDRGELMKGVKEAEFKIKEPCKEVFIGHTATINWKTDKPLHAANVWNLDTGSGGSTGRLTIMDVETKEYWQSDLSGELYKNEKGRW